MANIFQVLYILQLEMIVLYEKRGNYLPILHEVTCNDYLIITCLLKSNMTRVSLLAYCIELAEYNCNANLIQNGRSENCKFIYCPFQGYKPCLYIFSIIRQLCISILQIKLFVLNVFCIPWFFVIIFFWNVLYRFECLIFPNVRLL